MKNLFVPYNLALLAKEKGFNEPCLGYYDVKNQKIYPSEGMISNWFNTTNENVGFDWKFSAPLYQQLIDWFREKHSIWIEVQVVFYQGSIYYIAWVRNTKHLYDSSNISTYYEALSKALEEAFKLI